MEYEHDNHDELDWDAACRGLQFVQDGDQNLVGGPVDVAIERLLDQLEAREREAHSGEETHLRCAITSYGEGDDVSAYGDAWRASQIGNRMLFGGLEGFGEGDRTMPLREALHRARAARGVTPIA
ncbi:hypothetical protein DOT66_23655 [Ralstonia pseudosolanacearum]|uniref:hypothetical protein n=1 Tax=Ralstonia pseudosolanacearum TaxID=1310165 RepID=UPI000DAC230A|nr:hypothetical protein [Ralstonia pseudosolanacearum]RAA04935.1 hypothetical protein DOT66_23655 [Ralstonia pseudosolanacearum]